MRVLGIDPGYDRLGWGVVERGAPPSCVACGLISTSTSSHAVESSNFYSPISNEILKFTEQKNDSVRRLSELAIQLNLVLETYNPDFIGIESLFFSKNEKTAIQVAQARGTILSVIGVWKPSITVFEYTPLQIKAIVAGDGQADKKAVEKMVRLQLLGIPEKLRDDTLDALAAALTVIFNSSYGRTSK